MRVKKKIVIITLISISLLLTSCNGSREVDKLGIVVTTGMDIEGDELVLTHEVVVPQSNISANTKGNANNIVYVQSRGRTMMEAVRNSNLEFDRRLFLAHNRVYILGEDFVKMGISEFLNFYVYDNEPRESAFMVVAKDSKAYEIMGINGGLADTPGRYINDMIENFNVTLKTRDFTMIEFLRYFLKDTNPVTAVVELVEKNEVDKEQKEGSKETLNVSGGAVFKKDKLIGYFNGDEMMGFNFIVNEFKNGIIVFETPDQLLAESEFIGDNQKYSVAEVKTSKTKARVDLVDGELILKIDLDIKAALIEDLKGLKVADEDILKEVEDACSNRVKEYVENTMDKAQKEFGVDCFSIGNLAHIKYPYLWKEISKDWENIFPNLKYTVNVDTTFIRTGLLNTPVNIRKGLE